jgi:hypothetical protein
MVAKAIEIDKEDSERNRAEIENYITSKLRGNPTYDPFANLTLGGKKSRKSKKSRNGKKSKRSGKSKNPRKTKVTKKNQNVK